MTRVLSLAIPDDTLAAMEEMAVMSGREGKDHLALLVQDALRVYEWLLDKQGRGLTIAAVGPDLLAVLDSQVTRLAPLVRPSPAPSEKTS